MPRTWRHQSRKSLDDTEGSAGGRFRLCIAVEGRGRREGLEEEEVGFCSFCSDTEDDDDCSFCTVVAFSSVLIGCCWSPDNESSLLEDTSEGGATGGCWYARVLWEGEVGWAASVVLLDDTGIVLLVLISAASVREELARIIIPKRAKTVHNQRQSLVVRDIKNTESEQRNGLLLLHDLDRILLEAFFMVRYACQWYVCLLCWLWKLYGQVARPLELGVASKWIRCINWLNDWLIPRLLAYTHYRYAISEGCCGFVQRSMDILLRMRQRRKKECSFVYSCQSILSMKRVLFPLIRGMATLAIYIYRPLV